MAQDRAQLANLGHRIDKLPNTCYIQMRTVRDASPVEGDGLLPQLWSNLASQEKIKAIVNSIGENVTQFKQIYPTTPVFKNTGRAQCAMRPKELAKDLRDQLLALCPKHDSSIATQANAGESTTSVSFFAMKQDLTYVSTEFEVMAQMRLTLAGSRQVSWVEGSHYLCVFMRIYAVSYK